MQSVRILQNYGCCNQGRYLRLLQAVIAILVSKGAYLAFNVFSVPILLSYLGAERFAVWAILSSFQLWLSVVDLGIGNSLVNAISRCYAEENALKAKGYIEISIILSSIISIVLLFLFVLADVFVDWGGVFNVGSKVSGWELRISVALTLIFFLMSLPLSLISKIYMGYQQGGISNLFSFVGYSVSLGWVYVAVQLRQGLAGIVIATFMPSILAMIASGIWLFIFDKPWLRPNFTGVDIKYAKEVVLSGSLFFLIQVAGVIVYQKDLYIISHYMGSSAVVTLTASWRLLLFANFIPSLLYVPLWPAYSEAKARLEYDWIKTAYIRSLSVGIVITALALIILCYSSGTMMKSYVGGQSVSASVLLSMSAWILVNVWMNSLYSLLSGIGQASVLALCSCVTALCSILLSIVWVKSQGITSVYNATIVSHLVFYGMPLSVRAYYALRA